MLHLAPPFCHAFMVCFCRQRPIGSVSLHSSLVARHAHHNAQHPACCNRLMLCLPTFLKHSSPLRCCRRCRCWTASWFSFNTLSPQCLLPLLCCVSHLQRPSLITHKLLISYLHYALVANILLPAAFNCSGPWRCSRRCSTTAADTLPNANHQTPTASLPAMPCSSPAAAHGARGAAAVAIKTPAADALLTVT